MNKAIDLIKKILTLILNIIYKIINRIISFYSTAISETNVLTKDRKCSKCFEEKAKDDFYPRKNKENQYYAECKTCSNNRRKNAKRNKVS